VTARNLAREFGSFEAIRAAAEGHSGESEQSGANGDETDDGQVTLDALAGQSGDGNDTDDDGDDGGDDADAPGDREAFKRVDDVGPEVADSIVEFFHSEGNREVLDARRPRRPEGC